MFLQGDMYQASFPQVKFQMPAPNANKIIVYTCEQSTSCFVMPNDFGLIPPGLIKISCNILHVSNMTNLLL